MISQSDILKYAEIYLDVYRGVLLIDQLYRINVVLVDIGPHMKFSKDPDGKQVWTCSLNHKLHNDLEDIRLSSIEFLSDLMVAELDLLDGVLAREVTEKIRCRLFNVFQNVIPDLDLKNLEGEQDG